MWSAVVVLLGIGLVSALFVPTLVKAMRVEDDYVRPFTLKSLGSCQVTFKTSDSDGDEVNNYWTADVAGLYYIVPSGATAPIRMIPSIGAKMDGSTEMRPDTYVAPEHHSAPRKGYWTMALKRFEDADGKIQSYGDRHADRFGFAAVPDAYGRDGKLVFILSESGTMYKRDPGSESNLFEQKPVTGAADTDGKLKSSAPAFDAFPREPLKSHPTIACPWSKMD